MTATLIQVSTSKGGMPKLPQAESRVTRDGVGEDWQRNRKYHGGCDRAVCLYSQELYAWLKDEHGIDLLPGSLGENFTTAGIDLLSLHVGDQLRVGECVVEMTSERVPCKSLNQWHPQLLKLIKGHTGWLARVVEPATVRPGDTIRLVPHGAGQ